MRLSVVDSALAGADVRGFAWPMRAIQIERFGGPEVLQLVELAEPERRPGHALIRVSRAGVNYADTHQIENTYLSPATVPLVPGAEVVGTTEDGRRVVALVLQGGYAELALAPEQLLFTVPAAVSDGEALALVLQGTTAWHLLRTSAHLRTGETVVVHAAAGEVPSPVEAGGLMARSGGVIGFWLGHCFTRPEMIATALSELMGLTAAGRLRPVVGGEYPLSEA